MDNKLEKKYGLFTAICLVVGIVIGSGVFFKAQTILQKTNGDMPLGIAAWAIGGLIMIVCILAFANMAQKYEKVNGVVDYAEALVGPKYGYYMGWFMTTIYYPSMTSVLAWLSARYTLVFINSVNPDFTMIIPASEGGCVIGPECMALTMFFLCCAYAINALSPKVAGKIQTTTTVIKLIPLALMAVVGIIYGLMNGMETGKFIPTYQVTGAQAVTLAARLRKLYLTGSGAFSASTPWYKSYADYALSQKILTTLPSDMNAGLTRQEFAAILANAFPDSALPAVNSIAAGSIPDVYRSDTGIYKLYRAGILVGSDKSGTFRPNDPITRAEASAILVRLADPNTRVLFTLT